MVLTRWGRAFMDDNIIALHTVGNIGSLQIPDFIQILGRKKLNFGAIFGAFSNFDTFLNFRAQEGAKIQAFELQIILAPKM